MPKRYDWTEFDEWVRDLTEPPVAHQLRQFADRSQIPYQTVRDHARSLAQQAQRAGAPPMPVVAPPRTDLLLAKLPTFDPHWSSATCAAWLNAIRAVVGAPPQTPYPLLNDLLACLPADGHWAPAERERWLAAFTACLDVEIEAPHASAQ